MSSANAESAGVSSQVRFLGSRSDVWRLLCATNEFVMTSTKEGISISCIEASLSGRHMILTKVPGLVNYEEILPDVSYVDVGKPEELANVIAQRYHARGVESGSEIIREASLKVFSLQVGISSLMNLYKGDA